MSSNGPVLTIGIPTWNRKKELQECLELIMPQALAEEGVEVMVCDNASEDETQSFMRDFVARYPILRYERNATNIGPDLNFIEVQRRASGEYVWIFSDDDFVAEGAVRAILQLIRSHHPSYISVNYGYCDGNRKLAPFQPDHRYMLKRDVLHADLNQTLLVRNHWLSFLSSSIYRRDLVDFDDLFESREMVPYWIQLYMSAQVLAKGRDGYHSSFTAVWARVGNDRADSTPFVAYLPEAILFISRKFHVQKEATSALFKGIRETFLPLPSLLAYRARGLSPSSLIVPLRYKPALLIPRSLLVGMRSIYRTFKSRTAVTKAGS